MEMEGVNMQPMAKGKIEKRERENGSYLRPGRWSRNESCYLA